MAKVIQIPKVGNIQFPDNMNDSDIQQAAGELHDRAAQKEIEVLLQFLSRAVSGTPSDRFKKLSGIAQILEQNPVMVELAIAGLRAISTENRAAAVSTVQGGGQ
jgi:hypothetical protein